MNSNRCVICMAIALFAMVAWSKTCTWNGGSGNWNVAGNWQEGEVPADGDVVVIENDAASAEIVNDIEGLTLSQLFVTGSAAAMLSGSGVTLTSANAFSNGVASTVMQMPLALTAAKPVLRTHNAMTFRGDITASSATELTFYYTQKTGYPVGVYGAVTAPNANVVIKPNDNVNRLYRTFTFYGRVVAASLFKGITSDSIRDNIYLGNSANSIPDITAPYANIHCDAANVMTNAILRFGYCENESRAMYRFWDYSQRIDRFEGSSSTRDQAAVYGSTGTAMPVITMAATADSYCPATFKYRIALVWDPQGDYTLTFGKNRSHTSAGPITIKGGTAILAGTAKFPNVPSLTVADGAEFQMNSTATTAFAGMTSLTIGSGGKFTIAADAVQPFADGTLNIVAASDSEITIPAGMTVSCASMMVDGDYLGGAATTYTGWDNANPGAAVRLACLRGEGLLCVPAHARTCRWLGGGGNWSDYTKWKNSGVPGAGDEVVISNDSASAEIVNDLEGLSLTRISVIGSAAATLSGSGVTLTEANAFSNGVANTVCSMPIAFSAAAPYVRTIGNITFGGTLSGTTPTTFNVALSSNGGTHTITFNGAVDMPNANVRLLRPDNWNAHKVYFNGAVTAAAFCQGLSSGAMLRHVYLASPANSIGIVKAPYSKIWCNAANVMRGAVLQFGYCESESAKFELGAYDQTIDRFDGTIGGQLQGAVAGSGTLTMEATADCPCPAVFQESVSVVWAPKGAYALTFTNTKYFRHSTSGSLAFNGGTAVVDAARSFPNATALSVGDGAAVSVASTNDGAFASLAMLTVGSGATLTVASGAGALFADDAMDVSAAADSEISLPAGFSFRCKSFKVGDAYVTGEGGYYTGTDNPNPGTAKTLSCLRGEGTVYVPYRAPEATASTWTGGAGDDESAYTRENWQGSVLPNLTDGSLTATFASGGARAVLSGGEKFTGLVFSGVESFALASASASPVSLYDGGVRCASPGEFSLEAPLCVEAAQNWEVSAGAVLNLRGALSSPGTGYGLSFSGGGAVNLMSSSPAFAGAMEFSGCTTYVHAVSNPFGTAGATFSSAGGGRVYFRGVATDAPVTCNETDGNRYNSFNFSSGVTNVFNGPFTFTGTPRPSIQGTTIFAGGFIHTSGFRLIPAYGYAGTFVVTNVPARVTVGLQCDATCTWRLYAPGNDFGTGAGVQLNSGSVFCGVDWALDNPAMPLILNWDASLDLNGHDQRIGSLRFESSVNSSGNVRSTTGPATLYFTQASVATNSDTRVYGEVSLVKAGAAEFAVNRAIAATGRLEVVEGPFAFTPSGSWANATNVAVRGTGRLAISKSGTFGRKVRIDLSDSGRIDIAEGVSQRVGGLFVGGESRLAGTWGSSESGAEHRDDEHFSGRGVLDVAGVRLVVIIR